MKICSVNNQQAFCGKVFTTSNLPLKDSDKIEKYSSRLINFAKEKDIDYVIFKNGKQKGLSVLAKNIKQATREVFDVMGYPSGSDTKDINLILDTMQNATYKLTESKAKQGWSCE